MCSNLSAGLPALLLCVRNSGQQRQADMSLWRPQHRALDKIRQGKKMVLIFMCFFLIFLIYSYLLLFILLRVTLLSTLNTQPKVC